jgi:hypothetical protein
MAIFPCSCLPTDVSSRSCGLLLKSSVIENECLFSLSQVRAMHFNATLPCVAYTLNTSDLSIPGSYISEV